MQSTDTQEYLKMKQADLLLEFDGAKEITAKWKKLKADEEAARHSFLESAWDLSLEVDKVGPEGAKQLAKHLANGRRLSFTSPEHFVVSVLDPELQGQQRTKYANAVWFIRKNLKDLMLMQEFVRENGGIKGCAEKGAKLRAAAKAEKKKRAAKKGMADKFAHYLALAKKAKKSRLAA
jgi:hypothetical protein